MGVSRLELDLIGLFIIVRLFLVFFVLFGQARHRSGERPKAQGKRRDPGVREPEPTSLLVALSAFCGPLFGSDFRAGWRKNIGR
jgi:hypothetical protein